MGFSLSAECTMTLWIALKTYIFPDWWNTHKKTPTPTCFWPKYILTPLPFTPYYFPLYLIFLRTSFSQVKKKRTSHFQCLCHWYCLVRVFLCVDMDHGKYPSQLLTVKNTLLSSIFSISERKKVSLFSIHIKAPLNYILRPPQQSN